MLASIRQFFDWYLGVRRREILQTEVLRFVAADLAKRRMPVHELMLLSEQQQGPHRQQLRGMANALNRGQWLGDAMRSAPAIFPALIREQVTIVERAGALPAYLRRWIERYERDSIAEINRRTAGGKLGLAMAWMSALLIITFLMLFIVPTFEKMFAEFDLELPAPTELLIDVSRQFAAHWFLLIVPVAVLLSLPIFLGSEAFLDNPVVRRWRPGYRRAVRAARMRTLISVIETDLSPLVVLSASSPAPDAPASSPWQALQQAGWITDREQKLLAALQTNHETRWALSRMADYLELQGVRQQALWGRVLRIFGTLLFGLLVAFVCISLFMPLISLISGLT